MQNSVSISVPLSLAGVTLLRAFADSVETLVTGDPATAQAAPASAATAAAAAPARGKPGRKPNAEKLAAEKAAEAPAAVAAGDDLDLGESDVGDELGLDDAPAPAPVVKLELEKDVVPAFRKFLERTKGDKVKAGAVLAQFGVKSVRDLPADKYGAVIALLSKS